MQCYRRSSMPSIFRSVSLQCRSLSCCETDIDRRSVSASPKVSTRSKMRPVGRHSLLTLCQYERFWSAPGRQSLLWISILFSILHLANQVLLLASPLKVDDYPHSQEYLDRAKEALVLGNYNQGQPYSVEASLIIAMCIHYQPGSAANDGWVIMGTCARLAMKQGYHRDPSTLPQLSPFEGELRRRVFFLIETFDLLLSIQGGLPPMINPDECDTQAPSNLFDSDFDEDCKELPASRPETDHTSMLYFRYKSRLSKVYRRIYRRILSLERLDYSEVMTLDQKIRDIRDGIPPSLKYRGDCISIMDDSSTIIFRSHAEQMYLRGLCILHRYYLTHERDKKQFEYSRQACSDAALQILDIQARLHSAVQPNGQFSRDRWMMSHIALHDFLLAAMVLCVDLRSQPQNSRGQEPDLHSVARKYDALRRAYTIWVSLEGTCEEADRASRILSAVLSRAPCTTEPAPAMGTLPTPTRTPEAVEDAAMPLTSLTEDVPVAADTRSERPTVSTVDTIVMDPIGSFDTLFGDNDAFDWVSKYNSVVRAIVTL